MYPNSCWHQNSSFSQTFWWYSWVFKVIVASTSSGSPKNFSETPRFYQNVGGGVQRLAAWASDACRLVRHCETRAVSRWPLPAVVAAQQEIRGVTIYIYIYSMYYTYMCIYVYIMWWKNNCSKTIISSRRLTSRQVPIATGSLRIIPCHLAPGKQRYGAIPHLHMCHGQNLVYLEHPQARICWMWVLGLANGRLGRP